MRGVGCSGINVASNDWQLVVLCVPCIVCINNVLPFLTPELHWCWFVAAVVSYDMIP